jgi:hypothetical protein
VRIAGRAAVQGVFPGGDCELRVCWESVGVSLEYRWRVDRQFRRRGNLVALIDMIYSHIVFVLVWWCTVFCDLRTLAK